VLLEAARTFFMEVFIVEWIILFRCWAF